MIYKHDDQVCKDLRYGKRAPDRLVHWIKEREKARKSQSSDPIIQQYKFCNVNREDDAVTQWLATNYRPRLVDKPINHVVCALLIARVINEPNTLQFLDPFKLEPFDIYSAAAIAKDVYGKAFRGAYMITPNGRKVDTLEYFMYTFDEIMDGHPIKDVERLEDIYTYLMGCNGVGSFLSNQVVADLRYMPQFKTAPDWGTFVRSGVGTARGLQRFYGATELKDVKRRLSPELSNETVLNVRAWLRYFTDVFDIDTIISFDDPNNVANCLCEFDKYERALWAKPGDVLGLRKRNNAKK